MNICKLKSHVIKVLLCIVCLLQNSCIEPFELDTLTFEQIFVVEATITDEFKRQEILLSKTTQLEDSELSPEIGAEVIVSDDVSNSYTFEEVSPGTYISSVAFNAQINREYKVLITTADGNQYSSDFQSISGQAQIDDVRATRKTNSNGIDGVEISIDGSTAAGNLTYFRYAYEETYQIISLYSTPIDLVVVSENPPIINDVIKTREERVCYNTVASTSILLASSAGLSENTVRNIPIRFIASDDSILRNRYSINVKQFTQTKESYSFYENLNEFSNSESLFSQTQTGFLQGNISSTTNTNVKVLGFFEISSVSAKRIFFNFDDLFPDLNSPRFIDDCSLIGGFTRNEELVEILQSGDFKYAETDIGGIFLAPSVCVDCTLLGSNIEPDFWEE